MKKIVLKYLLQVFVMRLLIPYLLVLLFVACGDDGSDSVIRPSGGSSSDVILSSDSHERSSSSSSSSSAMQSSSDADSEYNAVAKTLKDFRDGQTYKTVNIGSQTWMAENLNFETVNSYCYDDKASNCTKYGRLYLWSAAMDSAGTWSSNGKDCGYVKTCSPTYPVRGVCPSGWHLPSKTEWDTLFMVVGGQSTVGQMLKSAFGWSNNGSGTDAFVFSVLPAGDRNGDGYCGGEGYFAFFWSSTEDSSSYAYYRGLRYDGDDAILSNSGKDYGFSVRCLKDDVSEQSAKFSSNSVAKSSSSQNTVSSSSWNGEFVTDSRDGQKYKIVKIGSQTWMAENLNYETTNSFCYRGSAENCEKYGRLYQWSAAMDSVGTWSINGKGCGYKITCLPTYPVRGICPEGWHLPTQTEWQILFTAVGGLSIAGKVLKSMSGWNWNRSGNGTDDFSFSALPGGHRYEYGRYIGEGYCANFWTSTGDSSYYAYYTQLFYEDDYATLTLSNGNKYDCLSVRCVKD